MKTISTKLSNLVGSLGCLLPITTSCIFIYSIFNGFGFIGFLCAIIAFVLSIFIFAQAQALEDRQLAKQKEELLSFKMDQINFEQMPTIIAYDALARVAVDHEKQHIYLWRAQDENGHLLKKPKTGMRYRLFIYSFQTVKSLAIIEDRDVISTSSKSTFHALETFIKSETVANKETSSKEKPIHKVRKMTLIIQMNDGKFPFHPINFYNEPHKDLLKKSLEYTSIVEEMQIWYNKLDSILNNTERQLENSNQLPKENRATLPENQEHKNKLMDEILATHVEAGSSPVTLKLDTDDQQQKTYHLLNETDMLKQEEQPGNEKKLHIENQAQYESEPQMYAFNANTVNQQMQPEESEIENRMDSLKETPTKQTELSYFERLVQENKQQLTNKPSEEEK